MTYLTSMNGADLEDLVGDMFGLSAASLGVALDALPVLERSEAWTQDAAVTFEEWVSMRYGRSLPMARELVRVARAVESLPAIRTAFGEGLLTWEQLVEVTWVAGPDTDATWADEARAMSVAALKRHAREARRVSEAEEEQEHRKRYVRLRWDDTSLRISGRLAGPEGALLEKALNRIADQAGPDPETGLYAEIDQRHADALVELAGLRLAADADADRATVVVHVDGSMLKGGEGSALLEDRVPISMGSLGFLSCDARIEWLIEDEDGRTLGIGRASRKVPGFLMRRLRRRDGGCRFPNCSRTWGVHAHHVKHWVRDGRTDEDNLLLLCRPHHRLIHRPGWQVHGDPRGEVRFFKPDGRVYVPGPHGVGAAVRERFAWLFPPGPEPADTG